MGLTGSDAGDVAEQLRGWLENEFGGIVQLAGVPSSIAGGLDSWIHRVQFSGATLPDQWTVPLVARVKRHPDDTEIAHREAAIQGWCANNGYPVPRIVTVFDPDVILDRPVQIMEWVPGSTLLAAMASSPRKAPGLLRQLAELQARLHVLDPAGFPVDGRSPDLADRRLALVRTTVDATHDPELDSALERVEALLPRLRAAPVVVCHGDLHPLNVLVEQDRSWVLDWTDAGLGDRHGDVARTTLLFKVASIAATGRIDRATLALAGPWMARRYLRAYRSHAHLDPDRLALWEPVHLLHGWSQVVGLHAGQFSDDRTGQVPGGDSDERTATVPEALGDRLHAWFEDAMVAVE